MSKNFLFIIALFCFSCNYLKAQFKFHVTNDVRYVNSLQDDSNYSLLSFADKFDANFNIQKDSSWNQETLISVLAQINYISSRRGGSWEGSTLQFYRFHYKFNYKNVGFSIGKQQINTSIAKIFNANQIFNRENPFDTWRLSPGVKSLVIEGQFFKSLLLKTWYISDHSIRGRDTKKSRIDDPEFGLSAKYVKSKYELGMVYHHRNPIASGIERSNSFGFHFKWKGIHEYYTDNLYINHPGYGIFTHDLVNIIGIKFDPIFKDRLNYRVELLHSYENNSLFTSKDLWIGCHFKYTIYKNLFLELYIQQEFEFKTERNIQLSVMGNLKNASLRIMPFYIDDYNPFISENELFVHSDGFGCRVDLSYSWNSLKKKTKPRSF